MKTFKNISAQGDVLFRRLSELPKGAARVQAEGRVVLAHSETGHDHVMLLDRAAEPAVELYAGDNPLIAWIKVNRPTPLEHLRSFDTHEPILFGPGIYEVRRQREYVAEGFRRVAD